MYCITIGNHTATFFAKKSWIFWLFQRCFSNMLGVVQADPQKLTRPWNRSK
ncbi:hypothetical protein BMETH_1197_1 [methanotrophic bacterial endosymbiont of Bathymodiolus sp.]|nr:hypothetical protein BMETH_1197_1 [methanotrophic bacterial endosymbiont of Bathymodiolus sp.]